MSINVTKRDYEILRTLVRVQLANTSCLQETFFTTLTRARKRLALLRNYGYIITHAKGLPGLHASSGSNYWRITDAGLRVFSAKFPKERIPENLVVRTGRASLRFFEHRNDMTSCYLSLIQSQDNDLDEVSARANDVDWRGEYEVVLPYQALQGARHVAKQIIPDGTLTTAATRYFVEVDRSTEPGKRIRRILSAYKSAMRQPEYRSLFPEELPACVLYVTKSASRAANLNATIETLDLPFEALAIETREAHKYLNAVVSGAPLPTPGKAAPSATSVLLRRIYDVCRAHVGECPNDLQNSPMGPVLLDVYGHLQALRDGQ